MVIVSADDPGMHSSQDEQDNRNYAKFAKIPVIEPSDSGEAKEYLKLAYELSERFDTPVLFRTTTRTSHSKSMVDLGERPGLQPLTKMTNVERMEAGEADLATVSVPEGMAVLTTTGTTPTVDPVPSASRRSRRGR